MQVDAAIHHAIYWPAFVQELNEPPSTAQLVNQFLAHTPFQGDDLSGVDRYVLTSNLHKAVRFGLVAQAAATAAALFRCDPTYFYRRLPVIALEDVGLGNLSACLEVLVWCRNLPLRRKFQGMGLAAYLGARLAATTKCRSACDLLCLTETQQGLNALDQQMAALSVSDAIDAVSDATAPKRLRAISLLRLDRLPIRNGDQRAVALSAICQALTLPPLVTRTLVSGKATDSMASFLPLIFELMGTRQLLVEEVSLREYAAPLDGAIVCAAADKHTRIGRRAIKEWINATPDLMVYFAKSGFAAQAERIIGIALFHVESSLLNRRLTNDCLELLREEYERSDMNALGIGSEGARELYRLMRLNHAGLNDIRRRLWTRI